MDNFNTLEDAQAEILRLNEELTRVTNERDTLSHNNESLSNDLEQVRKLNQTYFNKLSAQYLSQEDKTDDEEKEVQSCEDFARSLHFI